MLFRMQHAGITHLPPEKIDGAQGHDSSESIGGSSRHRCARVVTAMARCRFSFHRATTHHWLTARTSQP
jgi:hypothetical protein